jgi:hypothetical protein
MNFILALSIVLLVFVASLPLTLQVPPISGTNLTCINGNNTKLGNQSIDLSLMNEEYFKNLSSDNYQLAQIICPDTLNHTTN